MTELFIKDEDFGPLKGKHVVITGCSSGIGLATAQFLLQLGAIVTGGDINDSPATHPNFSFIKTDVTDWNALTALFKHALSHHSTINHVHANAGIESVSRYTEENLDANGDLLEPSFKAVDVGLRGVVNTCALGIHYMRKDKPNAADHSLVVTASGTSFGYHSGVDYTTTKHGVLGFMRSLGQHLANIDLPIRVNAIAPGWTATAMIPGPALKAVYPWQYTEPERVAQVIALLMADEARNRQMIWVPAEKIFEIESALQEAVLQILLRAVHDGEEPQSMDETNLKVHAEVKKMEERKKREKTSDH